MMSTETLYKQFSQRSSSVPPSFIREILKAASEPGMVSFAGGLPNPQLFPIQELEACAARVFQKRGVQALQYAATEGYYPLREFIANRYWERHRLKVSPDQILITSGSQQALDLLGKLFLDPGDNILLERPTYLGALQSLSMFQPRFEEAELENDGINLADLKNKLCSNPKLFYCIPNYQNPSGLQYSIEKRQKAAQLLSSANTLIIEDDPYGEISFNIEVLPPLCSYLPDQTIHLGSFSKTIAPGLRLGWMTGNPEIIRKASIMKQASDLHSGNLSQHILYEFLTKYNYSEHINKIRNAYRNQRDVMLNCLKSYFPASVQYTIPQGGMFIWLTLPETITARDLLKEALKNNIVFVPGDTFYASDPDTRTLRLNFSNTEAGVMHKAMKRLGQFLHEHLL